MAISVSWIWQVKPGRMNDFVDKLREVQWAAHQDGLLAPTATHIWNVVIGGPYVGTVFVAVDRDSMADLAAVSEQPAPRLRAVMDEITTPDGPAELMARNVQDVLSEAGDISGNVSWHTVGRAKPGRMGELTEGVDAINEHLLGSGAMGVRFTRNAIGGPATGTLNWQVIYPDVTSWAASREQLQRNEAWQQLLDDLLKEDGPVTHTASMLRERVTL